MFFWKKKEKVTYEVKEGTIRRRYHFEGRVQGVGFRFNASLLAEEFHCVGWVRNEDDLSVTMEIQGLPEDIDKVIQGLHRDQYIRIDHFDCVSAKVRNDENSLYPMY